jgi:hypothetical protein
MAKRSATPARKAAKPARRSKATKSKRAPAKTIAMFMWRHLKLRVTHTPNYLNAGWSHVELQVIMPKGAPCPITTTGYLSHFLDADELASAGGPIAFFTAWLERAAATKAWAKAEAKWRQLELFG